MSLHTDTDPQEYWRAFDASTQATIALHTLGNQVRRSQDLVVTVQTDATVELEVGYAPNTNREPDAEGDIHWETVDSDVSNGRNVYNDVSEHWVRVSVTTTGTGTDNIAVTSGR